MKLSLGFSPCPNDTFIFDAMIHHKIDTENLEFDVFFDDVETLNLKCLRAGRQQGYQRVTRLGGQVLAWRVARQTAVAALSTGVGAAPIFGNRFS